MADWEIWALIVGLGATTYLVRFSFIGLLAGRTLPPIVIEALSFVPVTVLPALVAPMVLFEDGQLTADPVRIVSALTGFALGAAIRDIFAGVAGGLGTFILLNAIGF